MNRQSPRIVFLGNPGEFSARVLDHLLQAGLDVVRVAVAGAARHGDASPASLAIVTLDPLTAVAERYNLSIERVHGLRALREVERWGRLAPDVLLTACFPLILPSRLVSLPRVGCFNLHPSLLPAYRGPVPLFWQLRAGERLSGVTLHRTTKAVDGGNVVAQRELEVPVGVSAGELNRQLADLGGRLAAEIFTGWTGEALAGHPQDAHAASYFSWPSESDFRLSTQWSAERAYRFVCGTHEWGNVYRVDTPEGVLQLERAIDYHPSETLNGIVQHAGERLRISFNPGVMEAVGRRID